MTQVEVPKSGNAHHSPFWPSYRVRGKKYLTYLFFAGFGMFFFAGQQNIFELVRNNCPVGGDRQGPIGFKLFYVLSVGANRFYIMRLLAKILPQLGVL